jgi:hypothetical protein
MQKTWDKLSPHTKKSLRDAIKIANEVSACEDVYIYAFNAYEGLSFRVREVKVWDEQTLNSFPRDDHFDEWIVGRVSKK